MASLGTSRRRPHLQQEPAEVAVGRVLRVVVAQLAPHALQRTVIGQLGSVRCHPVDPAVSNLQGWKGLDNTREHALQDIHVASPTDVHSCVLQRWSCWKGTYLNGLRTSCVTTGSGRPCFTAWASGSTKASRVDACTRAPGNCCCTRPVMLRTCSHADKDTTSACLQYMRALISDSLKCTKMLRSLHGTRCPPPLQSAGRRCHRAMRSTARGQSPPPAFRTALTSLNTREHQCSLASLTTIAVHTTTSTPACTLGGCPRGCRSSRRGATSR